MSGYVRLYRSMIGHTAFRNDAEALAFAWLVAKAQWQPARVRYKDRIIFLDRGQVAISVRDFANAMDRDKAWVERLLRRLRGETMVTTRNETGVNVITICNYNTYQPSKQTSETPNETPDETGARQGRDTEQEREIREEDNSEASASVAAPRQPLSEALSFWNANAAHVGWPLAKGLSAERPKHLRARLRDNGLEGFCAAITRARASPYLGGSDPPSWFTFDWLVKAGNFQKLSEGNYDRKHNDSADPTLVALARFGSGGIGGGVGQVS